MLYRVSVVEWREDGMRVWEVMGVGEGVGEEVVMNGKVVEGGRRWGLGEEGGVVDAWGGGGVENGVE
ncbi:hypothetical protein, partial [Paenibacillus sp. Y412MC10]|uniref:hypothetical protein n=1 Tax=Geobacillus sp. (strain Y412MC10) TaxID=481743 RepID=UPI001C92DF27